MIHARDLVGMIGRDSSFVKVTLICTPDNILRSVQFTLMRDLNERHRNQPVQLQRRDIYGQVKRFFVLQLTEPSLVANATTFVLALVAPCNMEEWDVLEGQLKYQVHSGD